MAEDSKVENVASAMKEGMFDIFVLVLLVEWYVFVDRKSYIYYDTNDI